MKRRPLIISAVAVALATGVGGLVVANAARPPEAGVSTADVVRGDLSATLTAPGNVSAGFTSQLTMRGAAGIVTKVYVASGDQVEAGDPLVAIDDTAARQQVDAAEAGLDAAHAALTTATQTRTSAERAADSAAVDTAEQSLRNAERSLSAAQDNYQLVVSQQARLVGDAQDQVTATQTTMTAHETQLDAAKAELATLDPADPADAARFAELTSQIAGLQTQLATDQAQLDAANAALAQAERTRDTAVLQARTAVTTQEGARDSAKKALAQQRATVKVAQQGPRAGTVDAAEAQVAAAEVVLDQARTALAATILHAPFDASVSTVNAVVGQPSSAGVAAGSGASEGVVTLVDPDALTVAASVAEADAVGLAVGQPATVVLPASGAQLVGTVAAIDPASTVDANVVTYRTTISLTGDTTAVRVGQTATVTITTATASGVLKVPSSAVLTENGRTWVVRVDGAEQTKVPVGTGLVTATDTEITDGLEVGDKVVLTAGTTGGAK
ncbi:Chromosome partition protein Smc [Propionicimonas sp. T2.31MG-18]|uniref:efflux RND transporter periplasmic adaptor subunit n=1 Tax=Propionicimonas sp. T2.31MG-18 TaxID=3157620 RepID=UPI0035E93022